MNDTHFRSKLAIITGGASGIGREIAERLAREGCHVCILDANAENAGATVKTLRDEGAVADCLAGTTADASISEAISRYVESTGRDRADFVVNAAAISPKLPDGTRRPAWDYPAEEWSAVMNVNITGYFHVMRAVLPAMIRSRNPGAIVNISSLAGRRYTAIAGAAYATSKAAVEAMTRQFAGEVAEFGIRINAVSPGRIETPMSQVAGAAFNEQIRLSTPLRRLGMPSDVADAVMFLLSNQSSFITGETLVVSGGRGL